MRGLLAPIGLSFALSIALSLLACSVAQPEPLTAARVVALARAQSLESRGAAARVEEARGRLTSARTLASDNPSIEAKRSVGKDNPRTSFELNVPFGLGVRRTQRIAEARAGLERAGFLQTDARVRVVGAALDAYYRVLHAERRAAIAGDRHQFASELLGIATDRLAAGDAARLEVLLAESELSLAKSDVLASRGAVTRARVELVGLLGEPSGAALEIAGDLGDRSVFQRASEPASAPRPSLLAAESAVRAAEAAISAEGARRIPEIALRLDHERSALEEITSPGLVVSLPLFARGQGSRQEARAARDRAAIELEGERLRGEAEAEAARSNYVSLTAAAEEIDRHALPTTIEIEGLARESYAAGKLDLPGLLVVRNNVLDARREHVDRLLEAARAGVELVVALGVMPEAP